MKMKINNSRVTRRMWASGILICARNTHHRYFSQPFEWVWHVIHWRNVTFEIVEQFLLVRKSVCNRNVRVSLPAHRFDHVAVTLVRNGHTSWCATVVYSAALHTRDKEQIKAQIAIYLDEAQEIGQVLMRERQAVQQVRIATKRIPLSIRMRQNPTDGVAKLVMEALGRSHGRAKASGLLLRKVIDASKHPEQDVFGLLQFAVGHLAIAHSLEECGTSVETLNLLGPRSSFIGKSLGHNL